MFNKDLEYKIKDIVEKRPSYGSRRITAMLRRDGIRSGRNRIRTHMRHLDLIQTYKKRIRKNVPRSITVLMRNIMWETDFIEIYVDGYGWAYLSCTHRSLFQKNKGISYSLYGKNEGDDSGYRQCNILIVRDMNIPHLGLRSDNGSQLTSKGYENYLKSLNIYHETIHAHTPEEDSHIESYFGHFKKDYIY
ncbi:MAG: IS3 family transposase [Thermoplasmatales archaeon]